MDPALLFGTLTELLKVVSPIMGVLAVLVGAGCLLATRRMIEVQIAFYRAINWRMEPLSWERELRNTRVMGAAAVACGLAGLAAYLWVIDR